MTERERKNLLSIGCTQEEIARRELKVRITESLVDYRREHLLGPGQLTADDWTAVYRKAGMTDKEIRQYRAEQAEMQSCGALRDPLDAYRA